MKLIPLSQNLFTQVNDDDYDYLNQWKWSASKGRSTYYAVRVEKGKYVAMHRVLLSIIDPEIIGDHIDGNGLNNQRNNIRTCNHTQNKYNSIKKKSGSIYKGVTWNKQHKKWRARITYDKKEIFIGHFSNEIQAAKAYDNEAKKYFGKFAYLNFK